jgi:predicted homoserine dehydrogenase-like protein
LARPRWAGNWGAQFKRAGYDALIVKGVASSPVYLWIHDSEVEIRDAAHLWSQPTKETQTAIRAELGEERAELTMIGPGGENMVRYACVMNGLYDAAGRTGMGAVMGLVGWARALGLGVLCGGNLHGCPYDRATARLTSRGKTIQVAEWDRWAMEQIPAGEAPSYAKTRRRIFVDWRPEEECGDPLAHMAVLANGTGLLPDVPVGHRPVVRYRELPEVLCPEEDGGILQRRGAVDIPTILYRAGEPNPGGGVFVVVANDDAVSRQTMIKKGAVANSSGTAMMLYRPYHLCGAETAMSILCAGLLQVPTGSAEVLPHVDIVATTARDLRAGEELEDSGTLGWS